LSVSLLNANVKTWCISAVSENDKTERLKYISPIFVHKGEKMISFYEIDDDYIDYLRQFDNKILSTKDGNRKYSRKYIGIMMHNHDRKYFIPLSSYKPKTYDNMYESKSLKKIGNMAVLRINNMIPVIDEVIHKVNFNSITDQNYKCLLQSEYRIIKSREKEIRTDSRIIYFYRLNDKNKDKGLYNLCCDYKLLEEKSKEYMKYKDAH
jgi:protein AbiQ